MLYLFWSKKEAPFTDNRESFFLDRAMPTTALSFLFSLYPTILQSERLIIVCPKKWLVTARKLFLIPDSVLPCLLFESHWKWRGPVSEIGAWKNI